LYQKAHNHTQHSKPKRQKTTMK